jgi:hypothetical protein
MSRIESVSVESEIKDLGLYEDSTTLAKNTPQLPGIGNDMVLIQENLGASTSRNRFSDLGLTQEELFPSSFREVFDSGETVQLSDNIKGVYSEEYNVVRFFVGQYPDSNTINFWLDEVGNVDRITDLRSGPDAATLAEIVTAEGLNQSALESLGITANEIEKARVDRL